MIVFWQVVPSLTVSVIGVILSLILKQWLDKRKSEEEKILKGISDIGDQLVSLKSDLSEFKLTCSKEYATRGDLNVIRDENTSTHKELWIETNSVKQQVSVLKAIIDFRRENKE